MLHLVNAITTESLLRLVSVLEHRLIAGSASGTDIDTYVSMQCEIAARQLQDAGEARR